MQTGQFGNTTTLPLTCKGHGHGNGQEELKTVLSNCEINDETTLRLVMKITSEESEKQRTKVLLVNRPEV